MQRVMHVDVADPGTRFDKSDSKAIGRRPGGSKCRARRRRISKRERLEVASASANSVQTLPRVSNSHDRRGNCAVKDFSCLDDLERSALAEHLGYQTIGRVVPQEVTVRDVVRTFPKSVYQLDHARAWRALFTTFTAIGLSMTFVAIVPWCLKPIAWFVAGTSCTGLFVIGHDCGHRIFHRTTWINDLVGHLVMTPLIYPYHPWRIVHNLHHLHTNKLNKDTGWHPIMRQRSEKGGAAWKIVLRASLGTPLKLWLSIVHWVKWHFSFEMFSKHQTKGVYLSWALVIGFMGTVWPFLIITGGMQGWLDFWLMPWLVYHFWMSIFTLVHHTAPHIPFRSKDEYHEAQAKLGGTVNCEYPRWVEFLCHDINIHIPHHLSARIPFYHLREATASLKENWGQYITECRLNWRMVRNFLTEIHLYDENNSYVAFDAKGKEETFLAVQRQIYPDRM